MMWHLVTSIFCNSGMLLLLWHIITSKWHVNTLLYTAGVLQTCGNSLFSICCFFRLLSPLLSSPLLSFVLPMMILSNPLHDMDYELMINTCEELGIIPLALRLVFFCQPCGNSCCFFCQLFPQLSSPVLCQ